MSAHLPYPGNPSLAPEVKERITSTFRQSLDAFQQGKIEEAILGCEFLMNLDPLFEPAKKLLEKARNPSASADPSSAQGPSNGGQELLDAQEALDDRDFTRAADLAGSLLRVHPSNVEAQRVLDEAREKIEAAPFIDQFVRKARDLFDRGDKAAAETELRKARSLDELNPGVLEMERDMADFTGAGSDAPFEPHSDFDAAPPSFLADDSASHNAPSDPSSPFGFTFDDAPPAPVSPIPEQPGGQWPASSQEVPVTGAPVEDGFNFDAPADFTFGAPATDSPGSPGGQENAGGFDTDSGDFDPASSTLPSFDFATGASDLPADDQAKIARYLTEGDEAFASGDDQRATDIWSRIFLIDVTNDEAAERIDKANARKREREDQIRELLSRGSLAFERDQLDAAKGSFEELLALDPSNAAASDYLARIQTLQNDPNRGSEKAPNLDDDDSLPADPEIYSGLSDSEIDLPRAQRQRPEVPVETSRGIPGYAIALLTLALLAGGWFGYKWFTSQGTQTQVRANSDTTVEQAQKLAARGDYDGAIARLLTVESTDPNHDRALVMIADYRKAKSESGFVNGLPRAEAWADLTSKGQAAFDSHDYIAAKTMLDQASTIQPLPPQLASTLAAASQQVAKLDAAKMLFGEGKYEEATSLLGTLAQQDPSNQNVKQMLAEAHFNLGAIALREERTADAIGAFDNVLRNQPDDLLAKRSRDLAKKYDGEPKDLLYRIFTKNLSKP